MNIRYFVTLALGAVTVGALAVLTVLIVLKLLDEIGVGK